MSTSIPIQTRISSEFDTGHSSQVATSRKPAKTSFLNYLNPLYYAIALAHLVQSLFSTEKQTPLMHNDEENGVNDQEAFNSVGFEMNNGNNTDTRMGEIVISGSETSSVKETKNNSQHQLGSRSGQNKNVHSFLPVIDIGALRSDNLELFDHKSAKSPEIKSHTEDITINKNNKERIAFESYIQNTSSVLETPSVIPEVPNQPQSVETSNLKEIQPKNEPQYLLSPLNDNINDQNIVEQVQQNVNNVNNETTEKSFKKFDSAVDIDPKVIIETKVNNKDSETNMKVKEKASEMDTQVKEKASEIIDTVQNHITTDQPLVINEPQEKTEPTELKDLAAPTEVEANAKKIPAVNTGKKGKKNRKSKKK
ncbi:hypothetical protein BB559_007169 [Furculomyces boomerangus]|uniref:Uncharacterized protein n=1 Tax=Furculomyces boomerangus TaxID=61424 RepID=A0A2T9XYK7_9FUNG|nr:hypothetical protein BB559_007169 [Furculomyces boomerangus]